jgi:hypothetical protein
MGNQGRRSEEEARRQADRVLDRVESDGEVMGTSSLARTTRRLGRHFAAADAEGGDAAELWGTRIARALAFAFVVFLLYWLASTYL